MNARNPLRFLPVFAGILLSACVRTTPEIVKIGVVAPFEGRYREIGVDVIPAARVAVAEWASLYESKGLAFAITAYDDAGNAEQAVQASERLAVDPDVAIVIGHWRNDTTLAAAPIYDQAKLPLITFASTELQSQSPVYNLSPSLEQVAEATNRWQSLKPFRIQFAREQDDVLTAADEIKSLYGSDGAELVGGPLWGMSQFYTLGRPDSEGTYFVSADALPQDSSAFATQAVEQQFVHSYEEKSLGAPPGIFALAAYQATWLAMELVADERGINIVSPVHLPEFDQTGRIMDPPMYVYQWRDGVRNLIEILSVGP